MKLTPKLEEHTIEVDGRRVYYTARGPEDAEYAYIGVCGLMGGADSFWPVIEGVPDDWRVVLPDLPGCGGSETMLPPHKHDIVGYSDWLGRFLEAAKVSDRKLVLASGTTGVPIAVHYAWDRDDGRWTMDNGNSKLKTMPSNDVKGQNHALERREGSKLTNGVIAQVQHLPFYG